MNKLDPVLQQEIQAHPQDTFRVIVCVQGDLDACQAQLEAEGFDITRRFRLIRGFGACATGTAIQRATHADWITSIEHDASVRTM